MFYSTSIPSNDIVENLRNEDPVEICAQNLRTECKNYDSLQDSSYRDSNDIKLSIKKFEENRPETWKQFFDAFFPGRKNSEKTKMGCDMIFQIMFNMVHNGKRKTPLLTCIAECIHDICKSKKLMKMLNRLSLCNSYDDVGSIDIGLANRLISITGDNSVPVEPSISSKVILNGVMDNWYH